MSAIKLFWIRLYKHKTPQTRLIKRFYNSKNWEDFNGSTRHTVPLFLRICGRLTEHSEGTP